MTNHQSGTYNYNSPDHMPRGKLVKDYIKALKIAESQKNESEYQEAATGTIADTVTESDYLLLVNHFWSKNSIAGLKHHADLLLAWALILRGQIQRGMKLKSLAARDMPNEGVKGLLCRFYFSNKIILSLRNLGSNHHNYKK